MIRYLACLFAYLFMLLIAALITPVLPLFKVYSWGGVNNDEKRARGWRLPKWLAWFDTPDNDLTGDEAHKTRYANPEGWWAMVCWLYRNPLYGFKWGPLGYPIHEHNLIVKREDGVFSYLDAFQWRKPWIGKNRTFGWLLEPYYQRNNDQPKAIFVFWN